MSKIDAFHAASLICDDKNGRGKSKMLDIKTDRVLE